MAAPPGPKQAHLEATERDQRVRRFLLRLSLANWGIAIVAWTVSAFLGITSPASIIVYSVLFVIGLIAAILAVLTYLLEKFGHEPPPHVPDEHEEDVDEEDVDEDDPAAVITAKTDATQPDAGKTDAPAPAPAPAPAKPDAPAPAKPDAGKTDDPASAAG